MKSNYTTFAAALLLAACGLTTVAHAQEPALIHHKIMRSRNSPPSMGRDLWLAVPSNEWGVTQSQTYNQIYITSPSNTTAYVQTIVSGGITKVAITAYGVSTFNIPGFWEVQSSGVPENKAIHVWSDDADLSVYFMSNQPFSSDGSYIIPTIGWGTDYVVAAYGSLFGSDGDGTYDLPSECDVVANQDNTTFTITPSCDMRQCTSGDINGDANSGIVIYPMGEPATFTINRGQCMQFMAVKAADTSNYDMSGSIIHANQPVGVLGASMAADIPAGFPYANFVCEMMLPVRTWGETYYGTNYIQPPGQPGHDYARYLFISSQPNQTIMRTNCLTGTRTECVIANQYGTYWDEEALGEKFYSSAPFLCVSYSNSSMYPDGVNGLGDPTECIIHSREQYTQTVVFEAPLSVGNIVPFTDFCNIITNVQDEKNVTLDGKGILSIPAQCVDDTFDERTIPDIAPGVHIVKGDSGVGVYVYGYGFDESYAWSSPTACGTFHSPDTVPPMVDTVGECLQAFVHVSDSGFLPDGVNKQSGLSMIRIDSVYNMNYRVNPNFVEGSGVDTAGYTMYVLDPTKPAILIVSVYDLAGNVDTIVSYYEPMIDSIKPPLQNLPVWIVGPPNTKYDTLYNTGTVPFDIDELHLKYGNLGFTLWDSIGGPVDKSPLQPGQRRLIQIQFAAIRTTLAVDSIILSNGCFTETAAVIGSGGANDFLVTSQSWINDAYMGTATAYNKTVTIENLSKDTITITSASWPNTHFTVAATALPNTVNSFPFKVPPSPGSVQFSIDYTPTASSMTVEDRTQGTWISPQVVASNGTPSPRFDSLIGGAGGPSETFTSDTDIAIAFFCTPPVEPIIANLTLTATGTTNSVIDRVTQTNSTMFGGLLGTLDNGRTWDPATQAQTLTPGQTATISVPYIGPDSQNISAVDSVTAIDGNGDTIGGRSLGVTVTVNGNPVMGEVNPGTINFGPMDFQTQNPGNTRSFDIQNTAETPLVIDYLVLQPGGNYNAAFTFSAASSASPTVPITFPFTLPANQALIVTVDFNDSTSDDPVQTANLEIVGDMCNGLSEPLVASIANSSVKEAIIPALNATVIPAEDGRSMEIILPPTVADPVSFTLVNVLGQSVLRTTFGAGTQNVDASALPRGVYFYRLTSGQMSQNGKVILGE